MASVYTNDLRLEEIGSGEQSGTWGDTTNTNLELIAEAFSFGTEASFSSDANATTTLADGAIMNNASSVHTGSNGLLRSGSKHNIRYEVSNVNNDSCSFDFIRCNHCFK